VGWDLWNWMNAQIKTIYFKVLRVLLDVVIIDIPAHLSFVYDSRGIMNN
jgi:hypothetical protein